MTTTVASQAIFDIWYLGKLAGRELVEGYQNNLPTLDDRSWYPSEYQIGQVIRSFPLIDEQAVEFLYIKGYQEGVRHMLEALNPEY